MGGGTKTTGQEAVWSAGLVSSAGTRKVRAEVRLLRGSSALLLSPLPGLGKPSHVYSTHVAQFLVISRAAPLVLLQEREGPLPCTTTTLTQEKNQQKQKFEVAILNALKGKFLFLSPFLSFYFFVKIDQ